MTGAQIAAASSPVATNLLVENPVYKPVRYPRGRVLWRIEPRVMLPHA
jgi:hypothetical protein